MDDDEAGVHIAMSSWIKRVNDKDIRRSPAMMICWSDATGQPGWHHKPPTENCGELTTRVVSIGFVVRETKTEVTLATSITNTKDVGDILTIPKAWIRGRLMVTIPALQKRKRTRRKVTRS